MYVDLISISISISTPINLSKFSLLCSLHKISPTQRCTFLHPPQSMHPKIQPPQIEPFRSPLTSSLSLLTQIQRFTLLRSSRTPAPSLRAHPHLRAYPYRPTHSTRKPVSLSPRSCRRITLARPLPTLTLHLLFECRVLSSQMMSWMMTPRHRPWPGRPHRSFHVVTKSVSMCQQITVFVPIDSNTCSQISSAPPCNLHMPCKSKSKSHH